MTHNERVLALLSDGQPHSHRELYGLYVMGHSRVADLRKQGHDIACWREGDLYLYRLLNEPETAITGHTSVEADDDHGSFSGSLSRLTDSDPNASRPTGSPSPAGVGAVPSASSESVSFQLSLEEVAA